MVYGLAISPSAVTPHTKARTRTHHKPQLTSYLLKIQFLISQDTDWLLLLNLIAWLYGTQRPAQGPTIICNYLHRSNSMHFRIHCWLCHLSFNSVARYYGLAITGVGCDSPHTKACTTNCYISDCPQNYQYINKSPCVCVCVCVCCVCVCIVCMCVRMYVLCVCVCVCAYVCVVCVCVVRVCVLLRVCVCVVCVCVCVCVRTCVCVCVCVWQDSETMLTRAAMY